MKVNVLRKTLLGVAALCFCWLVVESIPSCNVPPRLWCSSRKVARDCQVENQCEISTWATRRNAPKVNLTLYYETLCPDCKQFITNQLVPTFNQIFDIFNLELVPYGNAREKQAGGVWEFKCQHGPAECLGNLIQTCALHIVGNITTAFPFIACMEKSTLAPNTSGSQCAKQFGIDFKAITTCVNSPLGNRLQHDMAVKTDQLDPPHEYVPWITVNGVHTEDMEHEADSDLLKLICDTYTGSKPVACRKLQTLHKCSRYSDLP